jgi:hypothetical protein
MSKLIQAEFDAKVVTQVNVIAKKLSALSKLGARNVGLLSATNQAKITGFLRTSADKIDATWNDKRAPKKPVEPEFSLGDIVEANDAEAAQ